MIFRKVMSMILGFAILSASFVGVSAADDTVTYTWDFRNASGFTAQTVQTFSDGIFSEYTKTSDDESDWTGAGNGVLKVFSSNGSDKVDANGLYARRAASVYVCLTADKASELTLIGKKSSDAEVRIYKEGSESKLSYTETEYDSSFSTYVFYLDDASNYKITFGSNYGRILTMTCRELTSDEIAGKDTEPTPTPAADGDFSVTSSDSEIDISGLVSYGADTYRVYSGIEYTDVTASDGKISNPYGCEVTVVPIYRFSYKSTEESGYTSARGTYSAETGYGLKSGISYDLTDDGVKITTEKPLLIDLPRGYYDITVTRRAGRLDVYSNGHQIINNTTSSEQNRSNDSAVMTAPRTFVEDGNLNLIGDGTARIEYVEIIPVPDAALKQNIWIAGDSEAANYYPVSDGDLYSDSLMMTGFGMQLGYFMSDKYNIANWGQPSATITSWSSECMESVIYQLREKDILLIDFGINDRSMTLEEMEAGIKALSDAAKEKGAVPVLLSPVSCGKYQDSAHFTYDTTTGKNDAEDFAKELDIDFIDLNKYLTLYINKAIEETGDENWKNNNYHTVKDNLHMTQYGALLAASFIAGGLNALGCETTDYTYEYTDVTAYDDTYTITSRGNIKRTYSAAEAAAFMENEQPVYTNEPIMTVTPAVTIEPIVTATPAVTDKPIVTATPAVTDKPTEAPTPDVTAAPAENKIKSLVKDGNTVRAVICSAEDGSIAYVAQYNENEILIGLKQAVLSEGDNDISDDIRSDAKKIAALLWDENMKPLAESVELNIENTLTPIPSATAAPTSMPTSAPTVSPYATDEPYTVLYSQDFEEYTEGDSAGWSLTHSTSSAEVETDGTNKYLAAKSGSSSNSRSVYTELQNPVTDNFVFECDYRSSGNVNVSDLELLESKSSIYGAHGVDPNQNFVFTMARPKYSDVYIINNKTDNSQLLETDYTDPVFKTAAIADNPWLHIKVTGNFDEQTVTVTITSLDGETEYHHGKYNMNVGRDSKITSWKCIHVLAPKSGYDTYIDNIIVRTAVSGDFAPDYHSVTLSCGNTELEQYVLDGESVINIPDVSDYGESFNGWKIGEADTLYSSEELAAVPITSDCEIVGQIDESYIEALESVEFNSFPAGGELAMGEDENTYGDNEISLTITGSQGTSLVTSPDSRVTDYKIEWSLDGFRILDGQPTGDSGYSYCDGYGLAEITDTAQSVINFRMKKTSADYYGIVTAKVTYNGTAISVSQPLVVLGDKTQDGIFPTAGYTSDYNKYDSAIAGYEFKDENVLFGGDWEIAGSDNSRMTFLSDTDGNFIRYSRDATGNSAYGNLRIGAIDSQTLFEQELRFNGVGSVSYTGGKNTDVFDTAFTLSFDGSALIFNGVKICDAAKGVWYKAIICADPTTDLTWAKIYDMSGTLLGESETVGFKDSDCSDGVYYRILPTKSAGNSIDFNNLKIYEDEIDADSISVTTADSIEIPESGSVTTELYAAALTVNGNNSIGAAECSIDDEFAEGVSIEKKDANTSILTVDSTAGSGEMPIRCTIGGKSKVIAIKLIGTKNNIAFTQARTGIRISDTVQTYEFKAELRNGNGDAVDGDITYSLFDADNADTVTPDGVSLDPESGILTVSSSAQPQTIGIRAFSGDTSKFIRITLYSLDFTFGTETTSGTTGVSASDLYSDSKGYGFEGSVTESADGVSGDGAKFMIKLEKGKVYSVAAEFSGTLICENAGSGLTGFSTSAQSYDAAIFGDGIMDITLSDGAVLKSLSVTEKDRDTVTDLPDWWTIGDSTVQQSGSWGYTLAAEGLAAYPELAGVCAAFHNSGKAGETHKSYYSKGRLNNILVNMKAGDVVSLSGMGTNDGSSSKAQFYAYDKAYVDAILDMGGYVILGSYTPSGNYGATQGKVYDSDTMTFKGMRTNEYELAIRELYEEYKNNDHVLEFLDIGQMSDEKMTADVKAAYDTAIDGGADEETARAAADARAEELMKMWKDYNHYYTSFSDYILPEITSAAAEMIGRIKE